MKTLALILCLVLFAACREEPPGRANQQTGESWEERTMTTNDAAEIAEQDDPMELDDPANLESPLWQNDSAAAPDPLAAPE